MTLTRHAIGSGRALFTLPGNAFINATKPLEGRILDMTHTPTPWKVADLSSGFPSSAIFGADEGWGSKAQSCERQMFGTSNGCAAK